MAQDAKEPVALAEFHPADPLSLDPCPEAFCLRFIQEGPQNFPGDPPVGSAFFGKSSHRRNGDDS